MTSLHFESAFYHHRPANQQIIILPLPMPISSATLVLRYQRFLSIIMAAASVT